MKLQTIVIQPLLIAVCSIAVLHGQTPRPADPYADPDAVPYVKREPDFKDPKQISFCCEEFSLPLAMAAKLHREGLTDAEIYQRLIAEVDKGTAIQESFTVIRTRSGEKATSEAISEVIYPTEFEPAKVPETLSVATSQPTGKKAPQAVTDASKLAHAPPISLSGGLITRATPTAWETRDTGTTIEIQPMISDDAKFIDINFSWDRTELVDIRSWGQGVSTCQQPEFEAQKLSSGAALTVDRPHLIGTVNRTPFSKVHPESATRVWFAFATCSIKYALYK